MAYAEALEPLAFLGVVVRPKKDANRYATTIQVIIYDQ